MTSTKGVISLLVAGLALSMAGAASTTAAASPKAHPNISAKLATSRLGGPMIRANSAETATPGAPQPSENWSGYAVLRTKSKFNFVHSEWVQPAVTCTGAPDQMTSNWVGLDGFDNNTVEQDGTDGYCGGPNHTTPTYAAWYEMYPADSYNVFKVMPGDVIEASVSYVRATKTFQLEISDVSTNHTSITDASCNTCQRSSAEWVIERPAFENDAGTKCFLLALADFGATTMTDDTSGVGIRAKGIGSFGNPIPMFMVQPLNHGFYRLDATSRIEPSTDAFTETWERPGLPVQFQC